VRHVRRMPFGFVVGVLVLLTGVTASAGVVVSPLKQDVTVHRGQTKTFYFTVANRVRSGQPGSRAVRLEVMDFSTSREGGLSFHKPGTGKYAAGRWIKLSEARVVLPPDEGKEIACEISVPWTATGEYYSAIMVTLEAPEKTSKGVDVEYRIASGVFVTVPGRLYPKQAKVAACRVEEVPEAGKPVLTVKATIANGGKVQFVAEGEAKIRDRAGRLWAEFPLKSPRPRVLPEDERDFCGSPSGPLPAGEYVAEVILDYGSKWRKARKTVGFSLSPAQAKTWEENRKKQDLGPAVVVAPAGVEETVPPGGFRRLTLKISNTKPFPIDVTTRVVDSEEPGNGLGKWIVVKSSSFSLGGDQNRVMVFDLAVPGHAEGKHKATLQFAVSDANGRKLDEAPVEVPLTVHVR